MRYGCDCRYIFLDHISILVSDQSAGDERKALDEIATKLKTLTIDIISKLRFREAVKELELRELDATGTLTDMRTRLRELVPGDETGNAGDDVRVIEEESLNNVRN